MHSPRDKKSTFFFLNLDCFSKYLKYLRNIEKWSKFTKSSIFLGVVIGLLSPITLSQVRLFSDLKLIVKLIFLLLTPVKNWRAALLAKFCNSLLRIDRSRRYTYRVLQTIQMKLILLCVWAEWAVLGSAKTALKFKYEISIG